MNDISEVSEITSSAAYVTIAEAARKVRKALRAAFPRAKMSTRSGCPIRVEWDDTGPSVEEVTAALQAEPFIESEKTWIDTIYLRAHGYNLYLGCFNLAEREASQRDFERRQQEHASLLERQSAAVAEAHKARRENRPAIEIVRQERPSDPAAIHEAFERLREKTEAQVAAHEGDRRPSWAPPLILGEELAEVCQKLGYLGSDDKPIGRLWAHFATPKRSGRYVRENVSTLPLRGMSCRGFQLFAGSERQSTSEMLFEAQRNEDGGWRFGPYFYPREYKIPYQRERQWEHLIRERVRLDHRDAASLSEEEAIARRAKIAAGLAAIDGQNAAEEQMHLERQRFRQRALELARARVLDFIGTPDAQMRTAARLWGHCYHCGKELTDPLSLERGIGPDCYHGMLCDIRALAAEGRPTERIAFLVGASVEFVNAVLSEARREVAAQ
jgi:hypothetical protein